jgi:tRNA modification GTPase
VTLVFNKIDLASEHTVGTEGVKSLRVSALTGAGFDTLAWHLKSCMGFEAGATDVLSARARHLEALTRVDEHLEQAAQQLAARNAPELVAEELRRAQLELGEIVGSESSDQLLGRIFSRFCIGK